MPKAPTPTEFSEKFRDDIRVGFNWERFLSEKWPIERVVIDSKSELNRCFTPWYIGNVGDQVAYDDPDSAPMSLADVPKALEVLSDERKANILEKIAKFCEVPDEIHFTAATYALPEGGYFIMDRNHRLSALTMCEKPFQVELWNVKGPFEKECLLDLDFWLRKDEA